jgi:hypothetical protein
MPEAYVKNVAGDFYVEDGCCITCGIPTVIAPDIFRFDDEVENTNDSQCYVYRQPKTADEINRTLEAIGSAEAECIRYRGVEHEILRRIVEAGVESVCDDGLARDFAEKRRNIVHIGNVGQGPAAMLNMLAALMRDTRSVGTRPSYKVLPVLENPTGEARLRFAWCENDFHTILASVGPESGTIRLVLTAALPWADQGLSRIVHGWLKKLPAEYEVRWMTEAEMRTGGGQPLPY